MLAFGVYIKERAGILTASKMLSVLSLRNTGFLGHTVFNSCKHRVMLLNVKGSAVYQKNVSSLEHMVLLKRSSPKKPYFI